jgi:hypothetical protein
VAAKSLEELLRINPGDTKTLAQLVVAYAQVSMLIKLQRICPALTIMAHLHPSKTCGKNVLGIKCAVYFFCTFLVTFSSCMLKTSINLIQISSEVP